MLCCVFLFLLLFFSVPTSDSREKESKVPPYAVPYASPGKKMKDTTTSSPRWSTLGT